MKQGCQGCWNAELAWKEEDLVAYVSGPCPFCFLLLAIKPRRGASSLSVPITRDSVWFNAMQPDSLASGHPRWPITPYPIAYGQSGKEPR